MMKDPFENMGALFVTEVASKTNNVAGDSKTTKTKFEQYTAYTGFKNDEADTNSTVIIKSIEKSVVIAVESIKAKAIENSNKHVV